MSQPQSATPLQVSQYCSTATPTQNCMYQSRTWQVPRTKVVSQPQSTTLLAAQNYKYQVPSTAVVSPTVRNTTERYPVTTTKYHKTQSTVKCTVTVMQYIQCSQTQKKTVHYNVQSSGCLLPGCLMCSVRCAALCTL